MTSARALVDEREEVVGPAAVDREPEVRVRQVQRHLAAASDLDRVGVRLERVRAVVAVVRAVEPLALAYRLEQRDDLVVVGVHPRRVRQSRGEAEGALVERSGDEVLHLAKLSARGCPVVASHREHPDRPVWREVRDVHRYPGSVEPIEILADRAPAPVEPFRVAVPARKLHAELRERRVVHRRVAEPVLSADFERHPLAHFRLVRRSREDAQV